MRLLILFLLLFIFTTRIAQSQNLEKIGTKDMMKIGSGLTFSSIGYTSDGIPARRDPFTWFLSGTLNVSFLDLSFPLSYSYSNQHGTFTQPFNQVSFSPQYKWIKTYIGFNSMTFSSYTLAGYVFAGAGIELNPGPWRISAMYGRLNKAIPYDAIAQSDATMAYQRMGYGAKIGYEKEGHALSIIIFHASDYPSSIPFIPSNTQVTPKYNTVISLTGKTKIKTHFSLEGEYALSGLTRNVLSMEETNQDRKNYLPALFTMRSTSQFFSAYKGSLGYHANIFNLQLQYERVAPDYQTLGAYYFNNDLENITLAPTLSLFKGKLNLACNSGFQRNNLDNSKLSDNRRFVNALNVSFMASKKLSLTASYSNFSSYTKIKPQSDPFYYNTLDTLNFYQVSQNANAAGSYNFGNTRWKQSINLSASYQVTGQKSGTVQQTPALVYTANAGYNLGFIPAGISSIVALNVNRSVIDILSSTYWGPTLSLGKSFMHNTLRTSVGCTFNQVLSNGKTTSNVLNSRIGLNYGLKVKNKKYGKPALGFNLNYLKRFSADLNSSPFSELTGTVNLTYGF